MGRSGCACPATCLLVPLLASHLVRVYVCECIMIKRPLKTLVGSTMPLSGASLAIQKHTSPQPLTSTHDAKCFVQRWLLNPPAQSKKEGGKPVRGTTLSCAECRQVVCSCERSGIIHIQEPSLPGHQDVFPQIKGLDWHASKELHEFVAGTSGCDIWVVRGPDTQYSVLDGHSAGVSMVAPHPKNPALFVTADESGNILRYNSKTRTLECRTLMDFKCYAVAVSCVLLIVCRSLMYSAVFCFISVWL